jgi:hypothetical protein
MMYKHMVIYVGRSSVFTDRHFTEKLHNTLRTHEEHGWELVSTAARSGPLGDVSGLWLFFRRPAEMGAGEVEPIVDAEEPVAAEKVA